MGRARPLVTKETINKLKLRSRGAVTCIYDKNNALLREFSTIKDASYFCVLCSVFCVLCSVFFLLVA